MYLINHNQYHNNYHNNYPNRLRLKLEYGAIIYMVNSQLKIPKSINKFFNLNSYHFRSKYHKYHVDFNILYLELSQVTYMSMVITLKVN